MLQKSAVGALPIVFGSLLLFLLSAVPSAAQQTRAELIAAAQAEKAAQLGPEQPGAAERAVVRVMSSPLLAGTGGVYPWFGSIYPGAGFSGGIGYLRRYPRTMRLSLVGAVSIKGSTLLEADVSGPTFARRTLRPRVGVNVTRVKDLAYYGTGPESVAEARVPFDFTPLALEGGLTWTPVDWLEVDGGYRALSFETSGGEAPPFPLPLASGFGQDLQYDVPSASIVADWRPYSGYSTEGGFLRASVADYRERDDQPYAFREIELEAVQLVPILREQFGLAFRGLATFTDPDPGHAVPFVLLPTVGSGNTVRGYPNRRFADENRLVLTGEYRWRPSRYLDMAIFMDAGQVAPERTGLALRRLKTSWGIGARFHGDTFNALRFDLARSREGFVLVVTTGQPF